MSDPYIVHQWVNGEVLTRTLPITWFVLKRDGFAGHPTVDPNHTNVRNRYGYYHGPDESWKHIPVGELLPEFRVSLLLLGIT